MYVLLRDWVKMAAQMVHNTRGQVGRPRKHAGGWYSANKRICISNDTFMKDKLKLANDDAVVCYLLSTFERLNEQLQPERLVL